MDVVDDAADNFCVAGIIPNRGILNPALLVVSFSSPVIVVVPLATSST